MTDHPTPAGYLGSQNNAYSLLTVLRGHTSPLTCLSATDDGKLASGGIDGVRVWNLNNLTQLERPSGAGHRGATTALAWIRCEDEPDDGLVYGTANGYIVCWREARREEDTGGFEETYCAQVAMPGEITAIAFDAGSNRLAMCNRNSVIQVFLTGSKMDLHHVYSVVIDNHVPKALAFTQTGGEYKDILTFGLYDGMIHTLKGIDGTVQSTRDTGCMIGNAEVNARRGVFCVDDPLQGVGLYRLDSGARIRTYPVPARKNPRPRQVKFAEDCSIILSASDHGIAYVFDRRSGQTIDVLKAGDDRIQAITAVGIEGIPYVFAAIARGADESSDIVVWQRVAKENVELRVTSQGVRETWLTLKYALHVVLYAIAMVFIWQNIGFNFVVMGKFGDYVASVASTAAVNGVPGFV